MVGVVVFARRLPDLPGPPASSRCSGGPGPASLFNGILGTALAYFIWFNIIGKVSTAMASLGTLVNPVVGVIGAMIVLGDRLTVADIDRLCADLRRRRLRAAAAAAAGRRPR